MLSNPRIRSSPRHRRSQHVDGRAIHDPPTFAIKFDDSCHEHKQTILSFNMMRLKVKWRLCRVSTKVSVTTALSFVFLAILLGFWDFCFHRTGVVGMGHWESFGYLNERRRIQSISSPSSFAVVINTFRRPERLRKTVQHYAETCGRASRVGQVYIVWADQETDPPDATDDFFGVTSFFRLANNETATSNRVPVQILRKSKDSLNARFEPIPDLVTEAVFMVDDDVRVACPSLNMAFSAWNNHPHAMVGYYPRLAAPSPQEEEQLVYHLWPKIFWRQTFNIILTKASFLHSKYLQIYTNDDSFPKEIKDYVDKHRNCEDIAMSLLVANYTKHEDGNDDDPSKPSKAPILYVEGSVSDVGLFGGISSSGSLLSATTISTTSPESNGKKDHFEARSNCLTDLTEILRLKGWQSPSARNMS